MNCTLTENIFLKEGNNASTVTSIIENWREYMNLEREFAKYTEMEIVEYIDSTGISKYWDKSAHLKPHEYPFTYLLQVLRVIIIYHFFSGKYNTLDYD